MHRLAFLGIVFALIAAVAAPLGVTAKQSTGSVVGPDIGSSVPIYAQDGSEVGNVVINDVQEPFNDYDRTYGEPQRGYHYAMVDATVTNTGSRPIAMDPGNFRAVDSDGFVANFSYVNLAEEDTTLALEYLDALAPGTDVSGALFFEVFNESTIQRIIYSPDYDLRITVLDLRESPAVAGEPVALLGADGLEAGVVTVNGVADPWEDFSEFDAPARGTRYVLVDVTLENTSDAVLSVSPQDFVATDDQGFVVENAYISSDNLATPPLDYMDIEPGATQQGVIAYQVFADIPVVQITYGDGYSRSIVIADLSEGAPSIATSSSAVASPAAGSTSASTTSSPECQGLETWFVDLADRVNISAELVAPLEDADPESLDPQALRDAADQMTALSEEQADSNPPAAAQAMNDLFVNDYFSALASALNKLADATETDNNITALVAQTEAQAVSNIFEDGAEADKIFDEIELACPDEVANL